MERLLICPSVKNQSELFSYPKQHKGKKRFNLGKSASCCLFRAAKHVSSHETAGGGFLVMVYLFRRT